MFQTPGAGIGRLSMSFSDSSDSDIDAKGEHAVVDDGSTIDSSNAGSAAPAISDKPYDRLGTFLRLVDDFRAAVDELCLYCDVVSEVEGVKIHIGSREVVSFAVSLRVQRLAETLFKELLRLVYAHKNSPDTEQMLAKYARRRLFAAQESAATKDRGLQTHHWQRSSQAADTLAKELPDFLEICHSFADELRREPDLYAVTVLELRDSFDVLNFGSVGRISSRIGRISYLGQILVSEALHIVVTAPNGEPICALPVRVTRFSRRSIPNTTGLKIDHAACAPWAIGHVVDFITKQLSAQADTLLRACSAHEQRKFDELSSLIERAAEEETEQMNVDREALGESAKSRAKYPYTALFTSAVSDRGDEGTFLVVWGATSVTSRCGLGDPISRATHLKKQEINEEKKLLSGAKPLCGGHRSIDVHATFFSFRVGGMPSAQVVFVPNQDESSAHSSSEIFSCPSTRLKSDPEDPTALLYTTYGSSAPGSLFGSGCDDGVFVAKPKRFVFPSADCRQVVEELLEKFSSAPPLLRADNKGQLTPTVRLVTGNRVQPRHVETLMRRIWEERPRPESELLQSLANKSEDERSRMLSAMRLLPFGAGDFLSADTLLINLLKNEELDCVEWVDAVEAGGMEGARSDCGEVMAAGGIQIPLIRLHVVVEELKER